MIANQTNVVNIYYIYLGKTIDRNLTTVANWRVLGDVQSS